VPAELRDAEEQAVRQVDAVAEAVAIPKAVKRFGVRVPILRSSPASQRST